MESNILNIFSYYSSMLDGILFENLEAPVSLEDKVIMQKQFPLINIITNFGF